MTSTWLITGSSRGLGRSLAVAALDAGHRVVATARRPETLDDLVAQYGDRVLPTALDVIDASSVEAAFAAAAEAFGGVDVVVNNAGYANLAPVETGSTDDFRAQFETNFWGVYSVSRAAIPVLRSRGGGLLVQISSVGGRVGGSPGIASYQAAKFAIDGFSRSLRAEVAPFGIRVLVVEPSGFRTDWAGASMTVHDIPDAYAPTIGAMNDLMRQNTAGPAGEPDRAAEIIVRVADRADIPQNLTLGADSSAMAIARGERQLEVDRRWSTVAASADADAEYPVELPPDVVG